mmetsp:Transcript_11154/g.14031  ORF Transcript_11154/g.14031 Transcript_11154/m.14031 type:complete len:92 (+) Transcript_11154:794-1069(+)
MTDLLNPAHPLRHATRIGNEAIVILWQHPRELTQTKIGSQLKTTLTTLMYREIIRQYWINSRKKFDANDEALIGWKGLNRATKGADTSRKT